MTPVVSVGSGLTHVPAHDAMGNMIFDGDATHMTYNSQGRLHSVNGTQYTYNALGQRQSKNDGNKRAFMHNPMGRLLGEYVWNGSFWSADSEYIYLDISIHDFRHVFLSCLTDAETKNLQQFGN